MIGLIDLDLCQSCEKLPLPNLEIMKLASYFQKEKREYVRLINLNEQKFDGYEKVFLQSNNLHPIIPSHILSCKNVVYGGRAFSKGTYLPFEEEIIDFCLPNINIYKPFLRDKMIEGIKAKEINNFLDNTYYRTSNGKEKLPIPPIKPKKKVYIYDDNLIQSGWENTVQAISKKRPSSIVTINPIKCNTINQFFAVRSYTKIARSNQILLNLPLPLEELNIFFKKYEKKLLAEITFYTEVYLPCGEKFNHPNGLSSYADNIYYTLNILYYYWSKNIPIKLKYELFSLPDTNPFHELYLLLESWSNLNRDTKRKFSLIDKIKTDEQKKAYELFLKVYPKQKNLFLQNFIDLSRRGFWKV